MHLLHRDGEEPENQNLRKKNLQEEDEDYQDIQKF
jgi:hypothetical protein